ncbi:reverse transcriptase family protein [Brucella sp. HL-2]|nr:reverse transcriptase family protein [Brucella sp. HL-2]MCV9910107.1 reverse transcriptase family protein [Brucella sp. HL-2]
MTAVQSSDLVSLASFLGFAPQHIYYLVENADSLYTTIEIPKNSDKNQKRTISIPFNDLKGIQRTINKKILKEFPVSLYTHSYVSGRSIITATNELCGGKSVLKMDIKDFFPSITIRRVIGLFESLGFNKKCSYILGKLCTKDGILAQGSPSSPAISNLILYKLDEKLVKFSNSWEIGYVRYSDDLFFHHNKNFNHPKFSKIVEEIVSHSDFTINKLKTAYHPCNKPRITLGLLTHGDRPKIPGKSRKEHRAMFYKASTNLHWAQEKKDTLKGIIEWHRIVNGKDETYLSYMKIYRNIDLIKMHLEYRSE